MKLSLSCTFIHFLAPLKSRIREGGERWERTSEDGLGHYCNRHLVLIAVDNPVTEASDPNSGVLYLEKTVGMTRISNGREDDKKKESGKEDLKDLSPFAFAHPAAVGACPEKLGYKEE